ncbi:MAG: hypothetical protein ACK5XA_15645 [Tagaea sp.]
MAAGDIVWFDQALLDLGKKLHDLSTEDIRLGVITSAVTPVATTTDPRWGTGGSTNLSSNQVATGGTSYTGPIALTTKSWTIVSGVPTFRADVVTLAQDATGFANGRWGILFNNTDAGKRALGFVDLGADRSLVSGSLSFDWQGAGNDILTLDQV